VPELMTRGTFTVPQSIAVRTSFPIRDEALHLGDSSHGQTLYWQREVSHGGTRWH
jgi:hypothetical protein